MNTTVNTEEINTFFQKINPVATQTPGRIVIASFGENPITGGKINPMIRPFDPDNDSAIKEFIAERSMESNRNVYVSYALFPETHPVQKKGAESDVVAVFGLCADFDDPQAGQYINRLPLEPDLVLETSKGRFQAVYLFNPVSPEEAKQAAVSLKNFAGCDHGTADISHVWRIPGLLNWPNKKKLAAGRDDKPQQVRIVFNKTGPLTDFSTLVASLKGINKNLDTAPKALKMAGDWDSDTLTDFSEIIDLLPGDIQNYVLNGEQLGNRSEALFRVIHGCVNIGMDDDGIKGLILATPIGEKAREKTNPGEWLDPQITKARQVSKPPEYCMKILDDALVRSKTDSDVVYEKEVIEAFGGIEMIQPAVFEKYISKFKKVKGVTIGSLKNAIKSVRRQSRTQSNFKEISDFLANEIELFENTNGDACFVVKSQPQKKVYLVNSGAADVQIALLCRERVGYLIDDKNLKTLKRILTGIAEASNDVRPLFLRYGFLDGTYFIDLADNEGRKLKINRHGWQLIQNSPVLFRRNRSMKPITIAETNYDDQLIWKYLNVKFSDRILVLAFIFEAWRPDTQYVALELNGPPGVGKSMTTEFIRELLDPNEHIIVAPPRKIEDIISSANSYPVICLDNMESIRQFNDNLCVILTGGSCSKRKLYSDFDEVAIKINRPVIINGKKKLIDTEDLQQRAISIELDRPETFKSVRKLQKEFEEDKPFIFRYLVDLFSKTLKILPKVEDITTERMADFVMLGEAMAQALGEQKGYFEGIYRNNKLMNDEFIIKKNQVGYAIVNFFNQGQAKKIERKTCKEVFEMLRLYSRECSFQGCIESVEQFMSALRKIERVLAKSGIEVKHHARTNVGYIISILNHNAVGDDSSQAQLQVVNQ